VTDLQTLTRLQARVFEFLAQQDESTLHQLADGALQLTVTDGEGSVAPRRTQVPRADDPIEVARELQRISAPQDRAYYLDTLGASVKTLKGVLAGLSSRGAALASKDKRRCQPLRTDKRHHRPQRRRLTAMPSQHSFANSRPRTKAAPTCTPWDLTSTVSGRWPVRWGCPEWRA
jgi:hypothetical protein